MFEQILLFSRSFLWTPVYCYILGGRGAVVVAGGGLAGGGDVVDVEALGAEVVDDGGVAGGVGGYDLESAV